MRKRKEMLRLHYECGWPIRRIAENVGASAGTVHNVLTQITGGLCCDGFTGSTEIRPNSSNSASRLNASSYADNDPSNSLETVQATTKFPIHRPVSATPDRLV